MRTIGAVLLALVALAAVTLAQADSQAQQGLSIGVDADPSENTATSLGTIDSCVSVKKGDKFQVDLFITGADSLLSWETYFSYDGSIVTVTDRDVKLFLAADPNSDVFDASESLPSSGGLYRLGAVDLGDVPHNGSGVLARLTLRAVGAGISPAIILTLDADNDGKPDLGTRLRDPHEKLLGDANGDEFYDGLVYNAQIAVDRDCPASPAQTATPSSTQSGAATSTAAVASTGSPAATTPSATPASKTPTPATATPVASPTPGVKTDEGVDWSSPGLVAAYAGVGVLAILAVGGLAFFTVQRRRP